jgi:hypothetical protein
MTDIKIISGGQTGADQGGLKAAKDANLPTGGYAPRGYLTENGADPSLKKYGLIDSNLNYVGRTALNAQLADFTLWFGDADSAGYIATQRECKIARRPFINVGWNGPYWIAEQIKKQTSAFISDSICINIAGSRESKSPGLEKYVRKVLYQTLLLYLRGYLNPNESDPYPCGNMIYGEKVLCELGHKSDCNDNTKKGLGCAVGFTRANYDERRV